MSLRSHLRTVDLERVILVPIFVLIFASSSHHLFTTARGDVEGGLVDVLHLGYRILLSLFNLLVVVLLLTRSDARAGSDSILPKLAAYVASFLPFLIPFAGGSGAAPSLALAAVLIMALGMSFALYSLGFLGRSFGVAPQVRTLVRSGPYRFVRHPLYAGEIVALTGAVLFSPSAAKVGILVAVTALQAYRALQEERLLEAHIPEYTEYKLHTKMIVPGIL